MEVITKYKCEFCGDLYDTEYGAERCEHQHHKHPKISGVIYMIYMNCAKTPKYIYVEFDNGDLAQYEYIKRLRGVRRG